MVIKDISWVWVRHDKEPPRQKNRRVLTLPFLNLIMLNREPCSLDTLSGRTGIASVDMVRQALDESFVSAFFITYVKAFDHLNFTSIIVKLQRGIDVPISHF